MAMNYINYFYPHGCARGPRYFKNALSPYKLGGAAGGSDFDPKGKTENELMHFCQCFMDELYWYLGSDQYHQIV
ncbi:hypothetical protein ZOSMA_362G00010 [Zostera marina]|uniref:Glutamate/phenylalanine/leucine/valine/L-tryptophan dehydrogenase dimerisation domain-containing protein n=1 Tax=Zostera marina TaxID=29655 RepID=A0A0K9P8D3_ZOSMR|nr:hypothetical protein ZOSMA_362G00010 [Zostera marina]